MKMSLENYATQTNLSSLGGLGSQEAERVGRVLFGNSRVWYDDDIWKYNTEYGSVGCSQLLDTTYDIDLKLLSIILYYPAEVESMTVDDAFYSLTMESPLSYDTSVLYLKRVEDKLYLIVEGGLYQGIYYLRKQNSFTYEPLLYSRMDFLYAIRHEILPELIAYGRSLSYLTRRNFKRAISRRWRRRRRRWANRMRTVHEEMLEYPEVISEEPLELPYNGGTSPSSVLVDICEQSGIEFEAKDYSRSKTRMRRRNIKTTHNKMAVIADQLADANLGSKKKYTKLKFKKKCKTNHYVKPQSGFDMHYHEDVISPFPIKLSNVPFIEEQTGIDTSNIVMMLEKLVTVFCIKYFDKPVYTAIGAVLLMFQGSISLKAIHLIKDCFNDLKNSKATVSDFTNWLKSLTVSLDSFRHNKFAKQFMTVICKAFSYFLSPTIAEYWTNILSCSMVDKIWRFFEELPNPLDAILHAFTYLVNAIDVFVHTGSLDGFLTTAMTADVMLDELRDIRESFQFYKTGDIEFIKSYKQYEFLLQLSNYQKKLREYRRTVKPAEIRSVDEWLKEVDRMQTECQQIEARSSARMQPYHFILTSGSGISKSHLIKLICNVLAKANNIPNGPEYTYYLNQANKFQSGWKNSNTIVIVDDSAAMAAETMKSTGVDLADWVLRGANNVPHELLGADTTEKGVLFNKSLISAWASNSFDQQFHATARFPSAINRRFQMRIVGKVKPEYTKTVTFANGHSSQIDYSKLSQEQREDIAPDAWLFTCYECEIQDSGIHVKTEVGSVPNEIDNEFRYIPMVFNNKKMVDVTLEELLECMIDHSKIHFENQKKILGMTDKLYDENNYCSHGMPKSCICTKCKRLRNLETQPSTEVKMSYNSVMKVIRLAKILSIGVEYRLLKNCDVKIVNKKLSLPPITMEMLSSVRLHKLSVLANRKPKLKEITVTARLMTFLKSLAVETVGSFNNLTNRLATKAENLISLIDRIPIIEIEDNSVSSSISEESYSMFYQVSNGKIERRTIFHEYEYDTYDPLEIRTRLPDLQLLAKQYAIAEQNGYDVYEENWNQAQSLRMLSMKDLLTKLKEMGINNILSHKIDVRNALAALNEVRVRLIKTLQDMFDEMVCDFIMYFIDKIIHVIKNFVESPTSFLPTSIEGTVLGAYAYAKHPLLRWSLTVDYASYYTSSAIVKLLAPEMLEWQNEMDEKIQTPISDYVFDKFIRERTKEEKAKIARKSILSHTDFIMKTTLEYSKIQRKIKEDDPNFLRDILVPTCGCSLLITRIIPSFCKSMSTLYFEEQVGYEVPVSAIAELDKQEVDRWYDRKKEIFAPKPDVVGSLHFSDLERLVLRNTYYCKNMTTNEFCSSFSPSNKYLVLPSHFVKRALGKFIRFTRTEILDEDMPGNAFLEICVHESNCFKLEGDLTVLYVEQHMDHMRTKSMLNYLPITPSKDLMVGSLVYKARNGIIKKQDAKEISYAEDCNNENLSLGEKSANPFAGYYYYSDNFPGLCGAVLIDNTHKKSQILGLHLGGNVVTKLCVAQILTAAEFQRAIDHFEPLGIVKQLGVSLNCCEGEIEILDPYRKNPFFDTVDRLDGVELIGSIAKRASPSAKVVYTPICDDVRKEFQLARNWGPPAFKYNGDKKHGVRTLIRQYSTKAKFKHHNILHKASDDYLTSLLTPFNQNPEFWSEELRILNDFEVVNGVAGKKFLGGMNMSSSFGVIGKPGPKSRYAKQYDDGHWEFEPFVMKEFHERVSLMEEGILTNEIYVQCLKNEATPDHKIAAGKVRSFYMSNTITQMIIRKYLLTTCRYCCYNTAYSETMVGINPHDGSWNKFCNEFYSKGKRFLLALDLKSFDLVSIFDIVSAAIKILLTPLRKAMEFKKTPKAEYVKIQNVLNCIAHILLYSMVIVNGEVVVLQAIIASGSNLTSMLGSTVNSLNYRMAFYLIFESIDIAFRDAVLLRTYGDDSIANVSPKFKRFNVSAVLNAWGEIGIQGTDISKNVKSNKIFYKPHELEFLKRSIVYNKEFGSYVAPLDQNSMFKCLCCHVPPKTVSIEFITGQCVDNFLFEARYHGRKFYNKSQEILRRLLEKHDLLRFSKAINVTYDEHIRLWRYNVLGEQVTEEGNNGLLSVFRHFLNNLVNREPWSIETQSYSDEMNFDLHRSVNKTVDALDEARHEDKLMGHGTFGFHLVKQSGTEVTSDQQQVLTFMDASSMDIVNIGSSMPEGRVSDEEVSLGEFLKRPVLIQKYLWGSNTFVGSFSPWIELLENKRISNKIATFSLFRAKCKVRFVINGNGFYYGKLMCSYLPYADLDSTTAISPLVNWNRVTASQCPNILLDPTLSEGGEMTLPFFWHKEYVDLQDVNSHRDLGKIFIHQMAQLKHANQDIAVTNNSISISVYAWFEDVDLQGATCVNPTGIVAQSGREDETHNKPVSQFCTAVADSAKLLSTIPVITPYARAVEQGARYSSIIASSLGYCKPVDAAEGMKVNLRATNNMALTNVVDDAYKVTTDCKQELSIDPRLNGLSGMDEMSISRIASVDTYYNTFLWSETTAPETVLFCTQVMPYISVKQGVPANYYFTAIMGAAWPFTYWTGSLVFTFKIVASSFHRGRLLFVYDPTYQQTPREDNTSYTWIVDIADTREVAITIGNYQSTDWIRCDRTTTANLPAFVNYSLLGGGNAGSNGWLTVFVLNELTTPQSDPALNTDVSVLCYVKGGKDFKVAVPEKISGLRLAAQSGVENPDDVGDNIAITETTPSNILTDHKLVKYIGEDITSFRTLLKRYNFYLRVNLFKFIASSALQMYPLPYDEITGAGWTMLSYVMLAFSGVRGSTRWKIVVYSNSDNMVTAGRWKNPKNVYGTSGLDYVDPATSTDSARNSFATFQEGANLQPVGLNRVITVELPFYSHFSMVPGKQYNTSSANEDYIDENLIVIHQRLSTTIDSTFWWDCYVSAGEDFTCMFFTGWPPFAEIF